MRAPILAALALLGGCAQLNVEVDVIEPSYARARAVDAGLHMEAADIAAAPHRLSDMFTARSYGVYRQFRDECIDELLRAAAAITPTDDQKASLEDYVRGLNEARAPGSGQTARITQAMDRDRQALHAKDDAVVRALQAPGSPGATDTSTPMSAALRDALLARRALVTAQSESLRAIIRGQVDGEFSCRQRAGAYLTPVLGEAIQAKQQAAEGQVIQVARDATIIGDGRLLNNNLEAFYITNAPDRLWARRYNRAFGGGMFGSTSVAIVMNQTADFSVKGFIFDGRSVAQMVSKVGVQAISLIAAAHGAPINLRPTPTGENPTGSPTSIHPTQLIAESRNTVDRANAEQEAYDLALSRIADSVLSNWERLLNGNDSAESIVTGTVTAYRNSWKSTPPSP